MARFQTTEFFLERRFSTLFYQLIAECTCAINFIVTPCNNPNVVLLTTHSVTNVVFNKKSKTYTNIKTIVSQCLIECTSKYTNELLVTNKCKHVLSLPSWKVAHDVDPTIFSSHLKSNKVNRLLMENNGFLVRIRDYTSTLMDRVYVLSKKKLLPDCIDALTMAFRSMTMLHGKDMSKYYFSYSLVIGRPDVYVNHILNVLLANPPMTIAELKTQCGILLHITDPLFDCIMDTLLTVDMISVYSRPETPIIKYSLSPAAICSDYTI